MLPTMLLAALLPLTSALCVSNYTSFCGCCNHCKHGADGPYDGPTCDCSSVTSCLCSSAPTPSCAGANERGCSSSGSFDTQCSCAASYSPSDGGCSKDFPVVAVIITVVVLVCVIALFLCFVWRRRRMEGTKPTSALIPPTAVVTDSPLAYRPGSGQDSGHLLSLGPPAVDTAAVAAPPRTTTMGDRRSSMDRLKKQHRPMGVYTPPGSRGGSSAAGRSADLADKRRKLDKMRARVKAREKDKAGQPPFSPLLRRTSTGSATFDDGEDVAAMEKVLDCVSDGEGGDHAVPAPAAPPEVSGARSRWRRATTAVKAMNMLRAGDTGVEFDAGIVAFIRQHAGGMEAAGLVPPEAEPAAPAAPELTAAERLEGLGPVHLLWGVFHHYASKGDPTNATIIGMQTFRNWAREAGVMPPAGEPRRGRCMTGAAVDLVFTRKSNSAPGASTIRATHVGGLRSYSTTGRKGVLTFEQFYSAVRAIASHMYRKSDEPFELLFRRHIVPVALREGNKLLAQTDRTTVPGLTGSLGLTIPQEIEELQSEAVQHIMRVNNPSFRHMFNSYKDPTAPPSRGLLYEHVLHCFKDFDVVPRLLTMTQLLDMFAAVNDAGDDVMDVLDFAEFQTLIGMTALRFTPPMSELRAASPAAASLRHLLTELDTHGGPERLASAARGGGGSATFPAFHP